MQKQNITPRPITASSLQIYRISAVQLSGLSCQYQCSSVHVLTMGLSRASSTSAGRWSWASQQEAARKISQDRERRDIELAGTTGLSLCLSVRRLDSDWSHSRRQFCINGGDSYRPTQVFCDLLCELLECCRVGRNKSVAKLLTCLDAHASHPVHASRTGHRGSCTPPHFTLHTR